MLFYKRFILILVLYVNIPNVNSYNLEYNPAVNNFNIDTGIRHVKHNARGSVDSIRKSIQFIRNEQRYLSKATRDDVKRILQGLLGLTKMGNQNVNGYAGDWSSDNTRTNLRSLTMQQKYMNKVRADLRAKSRFRRFDKLWQSRVTSGSQESDSGSSERLTKEEISVEKSKSGEKTDKKSETNIVKSEESGDLDKSEYSSSNTKVAKRFKVVKKKSKKKKLQSDSDDSSISGKQSSEDSVSEVTTKKPKKKKNRIGKKKQKEKESSVEDYIYSQGIGRHYLPDGRKGNVRLPYFLPKQQFFDGADIYRLNYVWFNGPRSEKDKVFYRDLFS